MSSKVPLFHKIKPEAAAEILVRRLKQDLGAKKRVLWLMSGGSNIAIEVAAIKGLPAELQPYLAIMFDERYGAFGHKDSNLRQLYDAGFAPGRATVVPVLTPENLSLEQTAARYDAAAKTAFDNADVVIAQLGIGPDGHVSGILPGSPAASARKLVSGYRFGEYQRITFTFAALRKVTAAYAFAFGAAKREQLLKLRDKKLPLKTQPAQILKQLPEAYVYNDQIGEKGS
jgi:6-phosphogluconolactonase/glucosamine-6-phosphate isomerase/deaminase